MDGLRDPQATMVSTSRCSPAQRCVEPSARAGARSALAALLLGMLALSAPAEAAPPAGKEEFEQAMRLYRAGSYPQALPLFKRAYELSAHRPPTIKSLAQCERAMGLRADAAAHFREYAAARPRPRDADAALETARALEQELAAAPPTPAGADPLASRTGGDAATATVAPAAPRAPDPSPAEVQAAAEPAGPAPTGGSRDQDQRAVPARPLEPPPLLPPVETERPSSTLKVGLLIAGAAAALGGVLLAVRAANQASAVDEGIMANRPAEEVRSAADSGFTAAVAADALVGAGVLGLALGLWVD